MSLKDGITTDMKNAMRSGEKDRLGLIRMLLAAIKQREVDERIVLDDSPSILKSLSEGDEAGDIIGGDGDAGRFEGDTGVAGGAEHAGLRG